MENKGKRKKDMGGAEEKGKEKEDGFGNGRERRIRKGISGTEEIGRKKDTRNGRERKNDMGNGREGKKKKKDTWNRRETKKQKRNERKMTVVCTTNSGRYTEVWQIIGGRQRSDPMKSPHDSAGSCEEHGREDKLQGLPGSRMCF